MTAGPKCCAVHNHAVNCDGRDTLADMARAAWEQGVRYLGFSCHSHTPIPSDEGVVMAADGGAAYREEVLRLRREYRGRMEVLCGLEWDTQADVPHDGWDYWIGSVHNLKAAGRYYTIDWQRETLERCRDEAFGGDIYALTAAYFRDVARAAERRPTILGHIDQICKLNGDGRLFDEESALYRRQALEALHAADPAETLLEINTGAVARGYRRAPYPARWLLEEWLRMGGRIILTADAHARENLLFGYDQAAALAASVGYRESWLLTLDGRRPCPLS